MKAYAIIAVLLLAATGVAGDGQEVETEATHLEGVAHGSWTGGGRLYAIQGQPDVGTASVDVSRTYVNGHLDSYTVHVVFAGASGTLDCTYSDGQATGTVTFYTLRDGYTPTDCDFAYAGFIDEKGPVCRQQAGGGSSFTWTRVYWAYVQLDLEGLCE